MRCVSVSDEPDQKPESGVTAIKLMLPLRLCHPFTTSSNVESRRLLYSGLNSPYLAQNGAVKHLASASLCRTAIAVSCAELVLMKSCDILSELVPGVSASSCGQSQWRDTLTTD